jgi:hypothetical protein
MLASTTGNSVAGRLQDSWAYAVHGLLIYMFYIRGRCLSALCISKHKKEDGITIISFQASLLSVSFCPSLTLAYYYKLNEALLFTSVYPISIDAAL